MKNSDPFIYRPYIDGLRALAVFPVVLFHAKFPWFEGGFIGVDIFFVISGFLITSIILKEKKNNKFSLFKFYLRRIRRIIPALFFVTLFTIPMAVYLMPASDLKSFSESVFSVIFFVSNFFFWTQGGYFGTASELQPLLHTWSLGVEEQFYIFFPIFLIFFWKFKKSYLISTIIVGSILSLLMSQMGGNFKYMNLSSIYPFFKLPFEWFWQAGSASFYLPFGRVWVLMIGSLIAFYFQKNRIIEKPINNFYSLIGLLLIIFSIIFFSENIQYPSIFTLPPAIGTALIIIFSTKNTHLNKILSNRILVNLGLISFSFYLWHQPLLAFARIYFVSNFNLVLSVLIIILSLIFSYFSWKYIEQPFRKQNKISNTKLLTYFFSFFLAIFLLSNLLFFKNLSLTSTILPKKISQSMQFLDAKQNCVDIKFAHQDNTEKWFCEIGSDNKPISFAVIGDSHALAFKPVLNAVALEKDLKGILTGFSGCIPFLEIYTVRGDQVERDCKKLNEKFFNYVKLNKIKKVFLVARWTYYTDGNYDSSNFSHISKFSNFSSNKKNSRHAFVYGLKKTLEKYEEIGLKIIFLHQVPMQLFSSKNIYAKAIKKDKLNYQNYLYNFSVDYKKHLSFQKFVRDTVDSIDKNLAFQQVKFDSFFCDKQKCLVGTKEGSFYRDSHHLSIFGSLKLKDRIKKFLD